MASISQDKRTQRWFCFFRFGGKPFNKSTNTTIERQADQIRVKVEVLLDLLKRGKLELPPGADLWHWLISDGKRTGPISLVEPPAPPKATLSTLFDGYFALLPHDTAKRDGDQSHRDNMIRHTSTSSPSSRTRICRRLWTTGRSTSGSVQREREAQSGEQSGRVGRRSEAD